MPRRAILYFSTHLFVYYSWLLHVGPDVPQERGLLTHTYRNYKIRGSQTYIEETNRRNKDDEFII